MTNDTDNQVTYIDFRLPTLSLEGLGGSLPRGSTTQLYGDERTTDAKSSTASQELTDRLGTTKQ